MNDYLPAIGIISAIVFTAALCWLFYQRRIHRGILIECAQRDKQNRPRADIDALQKAYAAELREKAFQKRHQAPSKHWPEDRDFKGAHRDPGPLTITSEGKGGTVRISESNTSTKQK